MNHSPDQHSLAHLSYNPPIAAVPPAPRDDAHLDAAAFDLKGYVNILIDNRWLIGGVTVLITIMAFLYTLVAKPVYEANLMIHVEEESPNASKNILSEASSLFETKKAAIAEMELLRSRMVVSRAVDNLRLYIETTPKYFPIAGPWLVNQNSRGLSDPGLFGYGDWVWGGERADLSVFDVPETWLNQEFRLVSLGNDRYRFSGGKQRLDFDGIVGQR